MHIEENKEYKAEPDDTVEFMAIGDYGSVSGTGTVIKAFKNGSLIVDMDGQRYKTDNYFVLSKAG